MEPALPKALRVLAFWLPRFHPSHPQSGVANEVLLIAGRILPVIDDGPLQCDQGDGDRWRLPSKPRPAGAAA
jgi:hypothetical protein